MDEPLSNLDALRRLEMRAEPKSALTEAGTTVTHDPTEAMELADPFAVMHQRRTCRRRRRPRLIASRAA